MTTLLEKLQELLFSNLGLVIFNTHQEQESKEYFGCNFRLNSFQIKFRKAKVTPTKVGQFVTLWKRNSISKETEPFTSEDTSNFYLILTETPENYGFFLFTKDVLIKNQIFSTNFKDGKRGFRVYPNWDLPQNRQATKTQNWQSQFFIDFADENYVDKFESVLKSEAQKRL